jgi:large subunit ribosomal protein L28
MLRQTFSSGAPSVFQRAVSSCVNTSLPSLASQNENLPQDIGACRHRSNRSKRGLYDGKDIRSGNNVSFSMKSTKRKFKPNVFKKKVYSETLDEMIKFHLTTSALRSIDNAGGLDNYLLTSKHIASGEGLETKKRIINKLKLNEKIQKWEADSAEGGGESTKVVD